MTFSEKILDFFTNVLCPTPRPSRHEELIAGKLVDFASARGLTHLRDARNNVVIYKPGTGKYVNTSIPVILQAHTDMVCVPATADFSGGVEAYYSAENRLTGRGAVTKEKTSLGADDGIGVAAAMAVLDGGGDIVHPPLVAVFTAEEECGLTGARDISTEDIVGVAPGLDFGRAAFINLDDGSFGQFCVGCAGSANVTVKVPVRRIGFLPPPWESFYFELVICGLTGGHSGLSIHEKRGNANVLLCSAIYKLFMAGVDICVFGFGRCGDASNAIPAEASAYASVPANQEKTLRDAAADIRFWFRDALWFSDNGVQVEIRESAKPKEMSDASYEILAARPRKEHTSSIFPRRGDFDDGTPYAPETLLNLTYMAKDAPDGPIAFSAAMPQLVETSSNLGVIRDEGRHIAMTYMVRSSIDAELERVIAKITEEAERNHSEVEVGSRSPGWAYREKSALRDLFLNKYKELFGEEATATPVHAGLECAHFAEKFADFKGMDFISCGPTTKEIHSVNETLHTDTVEKFGRLLIEVLGNLYP